MVRLTLDAFGVPRTAYDGIVSSGDVTHAVIAARAGQRVFHIGPARDLPIFDGLDAPTTALSTPTTWSARASPTTPSRRRTITTI